MLPNYRRASERWPDASTLIEYYAAISAAAAGNNHGLVEHVKSFIECLCITILTEFGLPQPSDPSTTELLVAALKPLGLQNTRGANKLDKVLSAFNKLSDALSDMRNETGPVAHGKDAFLDALCADHARVFLYTGDAIVGVLLNALEGKEPDFLVTREPYERFKHLCDRIDRSVRIKAEVEVEGEGSVLVVSLNLGGKEESVELRIEPSRLLYGLDRIAFVELLSDAPVKAPESDEVSEPKEEMEYEPPERDQEPEFLPPVPGEEPEHEPPEPDEEMEIEPPARDGEPEFAPPVPEEALEYEPPKTDEEPEQDGVVRLPKEYDGPLVWLRPALEGFLATEGLSPERECTLVNAVLASAEQNMGVDWQIRESLQASLRVAFRRALQRSGSDAEKAGVTAERLVTWFIIQAPSTGGETKTAT